MEGKVKNLDGEKKIRRNLRLNLRLTPFTNPAPHLQRHIKKYERSNASPIVKTFKKISAGTEPKKN